MPIRQLASKLSPRGWMMAGGAVAAAIVFLVLVFNFASRPSYSTLMTGIDPAQTSKIQSTLDSKGISYQLQNNGTAIAVPSNQTAQARVALATAGLLGNNQPGFSLFDNQQLGASNFQQQITYQRALEGQLEQTIESIQGITGAQVNLVIPDQQAQLFSDQTQPATASVLLSGASALDAASVKGIAQLVASSVPGLTVDKVTIDDSTGALLWPTADSSLGAAGSDATKLASEQRYDGALAGQLNAMLTQTLGPGKAQVAVHADLNVNQTTSDQLAYTGRTIPLQQHSDSETLTGTGATTAGTAGTAGNIPGYAAPSTGTGNSNYRHTITDTTNGVDKTVTHSVIAPGQVNRQTVSVLVDKSVPASELPALQAAVTAAAGINPARGDRLSFQQIKFSNPTGTVGTPAVLPKQVVDYAKYAVVGLASLSFLFFVSRLLRRREHEGFSGEPTWVRELATPRPIAALGAASASAQPPAEIAPLRSPVNVAKKQVEELVHHDSDRVAQQVRAWMSED